MSKKSPPPTWADGIALTMVNRKRYTYLKEKSVNYKKHNLKAATSISGIPHIGNAKDVIVTDTVRRALKRLDIDSELFWIADDFDPLRKVPRTLDKETYTPYIGVPVSELPCPEGCCNSYSEHFISQFVNSFKKLGIHPTVISMRDLYKSGDFYDEIITAIKNRELIRDILNEYRDNKLPEDWYPWNPLCEGCGKMMTTKITSIDGDIVSYRCEDYAFKHATVQGCGFEGTQNLKDGQGKMPYRTEAAAQWKHFKITFEPWGKEHATKPGGTLWVNGEISEKVFNWPMPTPMVYEFFLVDGQKMSSSIGNLITVDKWLEYSPPELLKFLCIKKPRTQSNISLTKLPELSDEFTDLEKIYFGQKKPTKKEEKKIEQLKFVYEYCQKDDVPPSYPLESNLSYNNAAMISQFYIDNIDDLLKILEASNIEIGEISDDVKDNMFEKMKKANKWINDYGPDKLRFSILEESSDVLELKLSEVQKSALNDLSKTLDNWTKDASELNATIHNIAKENNLDPNEYFEVLYKLFIGKSSGPKFARFILMLIKFRGLSWVKNKLNYGTE